MSRIRIVSTSLVAAFALSACGGGGSRSASPMVPAVTPGGSNQPSFANTNFAYDATTLKKASFQGNAQIRGFGFDVMLAMPNVGGLLQYASQVSNPKSGEYRHFLTPQQIGQRFGASPASVAAAQKYFASYGLAVKTWPQNMMMHVSGSQTALQSAFNTTFGLYKFGTDTIIGPTKSPSVPANLGVAGSPNIVMWPSRFVKPNIKSSSPLSNAVDGYGPQQVATGFDYTGAYSAGYTGSGINIGVIGTGPIAVTGVDGITIGDVDATRALFGVGGTSHIVLPPVGDTAGGNAFSAGGFTTPPTVNSGSGCGPGGTNPNDGVPGSESPSATCNPEDGETQLDTEQTALLAPNATVEYYLAYNPNDDCGPTGIPGGGNPVAPATCAPGTGIPLQGLAESDAELQQAIADNTADVLSESFGQSELDVQNQANVTSSLTFQQFEQSEYAALASEGIAVFASSGDAGANQCQATGPISSANATCAGYPASDPNVVAVGGVTIPLNATGQLNGPIDAWGVQTSGGTSGSGGGLSILFPTPAFQSGVDYFTPSGELPLSARGVPDVSLVGDPATGVALVVNSDPTLGGQQVFPIGGTSVSAPEMAAMWSLVLQACAQTAACTSKGSGPHPYRMGDPNPMFYAIYGTGTNPQYPATFYNVVYGSNQELCETPGGGPGPTPGPPCPTGSPTLANGFAAGPGYNLVTGIGAPFARALIKTIVGV